jgi:uncharacterized protein YndB with AHSA1/START domain
MRHGEAARELLASRADVWAFLAEPHHLADWWPRIRGVQPDRLGFAPGARWQVMALERLPLMGWREPKRPTTLVLGEVEPYERWTWHLTGDTPLDVEIRLAVPAPERTLVAVGVDAPALVGPKRIARAAVDRLYDLVQTAAGL